VDEETRRRIVQGFFDTLYEVDRALNEGLLLTDGYRYWSRKFKRHMETKRSARMTEIPQLSVPEIFVDEGEENPFEAGEGSSSQGRRPPLPTINTDVEKHRTSAWTTDTSPRDSGLQHPLSFPRTSGGGLSPPASPLQSGFQMSPSARSSGELSHRGSSISPAQARDMLDDSIWVESIRKSKTIRRSDRTTYRYGDLG
jgi:hypothetical protein